MKIFDGENGRIVVEYNSLEEAGFDPDTKLHYIGELSDGYHTYNELYEFRKMYNAVLFNEWAGQTSVNPRWTKEDNQPVKLPKHDVHKSWRHNDGELCFGGDWFIVSAMLPTGLISNHYKAEDWGLFQVPEVDKAKYKFDGHTPLHVLKRLKSTIPNLKEDTPTTLTIPNDPGTASLLTAISSALLIPPVYDTDGKTLLRHRVIPINPSASDRVEILADLIDTLTAEVNEVGKSRGNRVTAEVDRLYNKTLDALEVASMYMVKLLTSDSVVKFKKEQNEKS